ncbi:MAG: hypothetical protein ABIJ27_04840 [Candidatus Omnitrophota bacterium]
MITIMLPVLHSLLIFVLTIAWGEAVFAIVPLKNERVKDFLVIPLGMLVWAVFPLVFSILLKCGPSALAIIVWSASCVVLALFFRAVVKKLRDLKAYLVFIAAIALFFHLHKVPGNMRLLLGDIPEYLQIARNIVNGLGYSVNFLIADHFNNGLDTIIRPVHNRLPLLPLQLASLGALIGFRNYLSNIIIVILAGNCLNMLAGRCGGAFKKLLVWLMPFLIFRNSELLWGGALEFEIAAYTLALGFLIYELRGALRFRYVLFASLLEIGILYGGNGVGLYIMGAAACAAFMLFVYQKIWSPGFRILKGANFAAYFVLLPALLFAPWLMRSVSGGAAGNCLYNFTSYDSEENRIVFGKKFYDVIEEKGDFQEEEKEEKIGGVEEEEKKRYDTSPYVINVAMSYYFFKKDVDFGDLLDHANIGAFVRSTASNARFLKRCVIGTLFRMRDYYETFWGTNVFFYCGALLLLFFVVRAGRLLLFFVIFNGTLFLYIFVMRLVTCPLPRMAIPFLVAHWGSVAYLIENAVHFPNKKRILISWLLIAFSASTFVYNIHKSMNTNTEIPVIAQWIREHTKKEDLLYVDPPQLFTFLTERRAVGSSWSDRFVTMADEKYRPDYFIINRIRSERAYKNIKKKIYEQYDVLVDDPKHYYSIFRRKP